jgi:hypothetical protein
LSSGGEQTGLAAFREAQLPRARAYVAAVCSPDRSEEAISAAFVDFLARAGGEVRGDGEPAPDRELDRALLHATRSAAAGRFLVVVPQGRPELSLTPECRAMPELLALRANDERPGDEALIGGHLAGCAICARTLARMQEAERAFARGSGELPSLDIEVTTIDTTKFPAPPAPPLAPDSPGAADPGGSSPRSASPLAPDDEESDPLLQPESIPTPRNHQRSSEMPLEPGGTHRRRSGGLAGAIRKLGRAPRG